MIHYIPAYHTANHNAKYLKAHWEIYKNTLRNIQKHSAKSNVHRNSQNRNNPQPR